LLVNKGNRYFSDIASLKLDLNYEIKKLDNIKINKFNNKIYKEYINSKNVDLNNFEESIEKCFGKELL